MNPPSRQRGFVRTVLRDIPPEKLGVCYAHEHIIIDPSFTTHCYPDFLLDSVENAVQELREFYRAGGRAMVDSMPCDSGRNVLKLAEISRRSAVHIICPTGLHLEKYYDPGHWSRSCPEAQLAALFIADIEDGIDAHDYKGPFVERTKHRAGVIKIASGLEGVSAREAGIFRAAAAAHRRTGCPILTHTEQGTAALEQVDLLEKEGVDLSRATLSHTDRKPDLEYHRAILRRGVKVEYDNAFRWKAPQGNPTLDLVVRLAPQFPNQIMLGMDAARRSYWASYGGKPGLNYLLVEFRRQLRAAGLGEELLENIFVANPARAYAFASVPAHPPFSSSLTWRYNRHRPARLRP